MKLQTTTDMNWLEEATIDDVQIGMEEGRLSAYHLVLYYIQRIAQLDTAGPKLNSILELNPDAVFIAKALDQERKRKPAQPPARYSHSA